MIVRDRRFKGYGSASSLLDPDYTTLDPNSPDVSVSPGTGPVAPVLVPQPVPFFTPTEDGTYVLAQDGDTSVNWKPIAAVGGGALLLGLAAWLAR